MTTTIAATIKYSSEGDIPPGGTAGVEENEILKKEKEASVAAPP